MLAGVDLAREGAETGLAAGLLVAALSFVSALAVIAILLRVLDRIGFLPFVVYRVLLAVLLLAIFGLTVGG
jgi:undecaprenyl-diphosphatase